MANRLEKFSRYRCWLQPTSAARPQTVHASCGGYGNHAIATLTFGKLRVANFFGVSSKPPSEKPIKTTHLLTVPSPTDDLVNTQNPLPTLSSVGNGEARENIRHILLGSPGAVRQTIHLLHNLHYAETVLWSPVITIEEPLVITPAQGEAMSLLKRHI